MNSPHEDIEKLRRLLALKRHEQPPPGYFNHFADKIIARLETEGPVAKPSWWARLFPELDARPLFVCAYGLILVGLLVVGLGASQSLDPADETVSLGSQWFAATPAPVPPSLSMPAGTTAWAGQSEPASSFTPMMSSTAPNHLFDPNFWAGSERASFRFR